MSQIKLTPEELRISAQKYTTGSQSITDVLTVLTQEQAVIDENWDGTAFDSFEAQFNELSPKITHPVSTEIPGDWHCTVKISFNDKKSIVYNITHNLESKKNYSGKFNEKNMNFFDSRIGKTKKL